MLLIDLHQLAPFPVVADSNVGYHPAQDEYTAEVVQELPEVPPPPAEGDGSPL